ncbi:hypothetical protein [Anatilimnocola floriformis]|uniref:hypothetical protein n=1 Tax=Anatilimnocola floriformis TaxID=2948575 RepID=UPI0020C4B95D|nr:hypothetical protein [Anatilimnocola floriformis]
MEVGDGSYVPAPLDYFAAASVLRSRCTLAAGQLEELAAGRGSISTAVNTLHALSARCELISRNLALLNLRPSEPSAAVKEIERPITGDLLAYCMAVEEANSTQLQMAPAEPMDSIQSFNA